MRSTLKFFLLVYLVSWTCFFGASAISGGTLSPSHLTFLSAPILFLGVFAPALIAVALTAYERGRTGLQALLSKTTRWRVSVKWYLFAVTYMAGIKLIAACVHRLAIGSWPAFGEVPFYLLPIAVLFSTPVQAGEEIGWRGYALPRLWAHVGLPWASVILGVIWACWHLPIFFIPGNENYGQSFPLYLLDVAAMSVAMAWLYWRTDGSVLLTMLMHAAINNTKDIVPSAVLGGSNPLTLRASFVGWTTAALLWICACYFLFQMRRAKLGAQEQRTTSDDKR